ncbi:MAG: ABC transporter ATP-binding protein/permease [Spirochaetaceae bacterium]|jgi:ATP-binding cassette subfamily B protein|nr:ABC transporter ATP-binding protein/permease [Spirochaetaceae bacterium]
MTEGGAAARSSILREYRTLLPYFARYKRRYIAGFICLIIVDGAQILIPQLIRRALNIMQNVSFVWLEVFKLCVAMTLTMLIIAFGRFLWRYFLHGASRQIEAELREKLFEHLLVMDSAFYQKNKTGDLMARGANDTTAIRMAIGWGLVGGVDGTLMAAGILAVIFFQAPAVAAYTILPVPFITLLIILFGRALGSRFRRAHEAYSSMSELVRETFAGVRVIKSFVREETFLEKAKHENAEYVNANMSVVRLHGLFFPLILFLAGLTMLIVLWAGGGAVIRGKMRAGDLVSLISYIQMLIWPMFGAGFTVNMIQRGAISMSRINEVLNAEPEIKDGRTEAGAAAAEACPLIEIKSLNFAYGGGAHALKNINLSINEGEWLGIFGRTGAGKSTLIRLLPRILDAPPGTVFVNGVDVREWKLAELRSVFGVAPQDSFLFSDTIANNIRYGCGDAAFLPPVVQLAALEKDIAGFKAGFETTIGERGLTLSGGQKQRVTIARAAIIEPRVLILDDSLSACDAETEKTILSNLEAARRGKTTIIISHRVSAFRQAANVAVLEDGVLSEYGTPESLLAAGGYYAKTARLQQLENPS